MLFFLACPAGELRVERVVGVQEGLFAVQDRRVGALAAIIAFQLARSQRELPARLNAATLARDLAGFGYPGFAYLRPRHWTPKNPGEVLLSALAQ